MSPNSYIDENYISVVRVSVESVRVNLTTLR